MRCVLCENQKDKQKITTQSRIFYRCENCALVFLDSSFHLSQEQERKRYCLHQNQDSEEYRSFLKRLAQPLFERLRKDSDGLDYGCGPVKIMERIFSDEGYPMHSYDPFFFPSQEIFFKQYDFITCSEAAEHFFHPRKEFDKIFEYLKPGGILGLMTQFCVSMETFPSWYYHRDPTHVCFYSIESLQWLASNYDASLTLLRPSVAIFQKNN